MARTLKLSRRDSSEIFTLSLDKIFGPKIWQAFFTSSDGVHLNYQGLKILTSAIRFAALKTEVTSVTEVPSIPIGTSITRWRKEFRFKNPDLPTISVPHHLTLDSRSLDKHRNIPSVSPNLSNRLSFNPRGQGYQRPYRVHPYRGQRGGGYQGTGSNKLSGQRRYGRPY